MRTLRFPLGIEPNFIDGIAVSHTIVKDGFINDYMVSGQVIEGSQFFVVFRFVGLGSRYNRLRAEKLMEVTLPVPRKDFIVDCLVQIPRCYTIQDRLGA